MTAPRSGERAGGGGHVVLLGDRGPITRALFHALETALAERATVSAILEAPPSRVALVRRRARRLGWVEVSGHVAFMLLVMPVLKLVGRSRVQEVGAAHGMDFGPIGRAVHVGSVNDATTRAVLRELSPDLVVVHGTRVISGAVLGGITVPVINVHAGITPRYRGVHGGYWAIYEGRPDLSGTTVHLVDTGIDTGGILRQAVFEWGPGDSIATYPYLHLACGLPLVVETVTAALDGHPLEVQPPLAGAEVSKLRWHPTAWAYLMARFRRGVR